MKKLKTTAFVALTCTLLLSCNAQSQTKSTTQTEKTTRSIVKKTYKLKGFKQSCCSGMVNYSLEEVNGFVKSEANVDKQELTVWFDTAKCKEDEIKKAINKTSYKILKTL